MRVCRSLERGSAETDIYRIVPQLSLPEPSAFVLLPATESTFHITELTGNFCSLIFSRLENVFCIAKTKTYPIEI
ncbi:hypothetical protein SAMN05421548_1097 [Paraburkholderia lycopersici]|uniref:Uncharacterized protein n=1 Tax=Paraburkholderia lycopersici TaxID=416944 RepID=A0A1G6NE73_9BURK|nr:hypothetical protein SAMN05421548_1097 [Paraburkholderia lycopersici]